MNISQKLARISLGPVSSWQRAATTEAVKRASKHKAAPPSPKPRAMKTPNFRGMTAYALYITQLAAERKKAGEKFLLDVDTAELWKSLPESEKAKLFEQVSEINSQRKSLYDEFVSKLSPSEIVAENKKRADLRKERIAAGKSVTNLSPILDKNAPKRPVNSFFLYSQEARPSIEYQGMSMLEQTSAIAEKWRSMTEDEKSKYNQKAKELRDEYLQKKAVYYGTE